MLADIFPSDLPTLLVEFCLLGRVMRVFLALIGERGGRHKFATDFEVLKQRNYVHKFSRKTAEITRGRGREREKAAGGEAQLRPISK